MTVPYSLPIIFLNNKYKSNRNLKMSKTSLIFSNQVFFCFTFLGVDIIVDLIMPPGLIGRALPNV